MRNRESKPTANSRQTFIDGGRRPTARGTKLFATFLPLQHRETKLRVRTITLDTLEHARRRSDERRECRVILDLAERLLARQRNLHTRVEHVLRIERVLHSPRDLENLRARRACEQRGAQRAIAVLTRERTAELRGEIHDVGEDAGDAVAPTITPNVDERIYMHVRITRVAE